MSDTNRTLKKISALLPQAMAADRQALYSGIQRLRRSHTDLSPEKFQQRLDFLKKKLAVSIKRKHWRKKNLPEPADNLSLPITARKADLIEAINKNQVVIISGETGSGKTTQIPKFCLAAGRGIDGLIGCTQPRRIAATTVSHRVAEELGEEIGRTIGYKIRFSDRTGKNTFIKMMTDGILLAEAQKDPYLSEYDTIIVDEAHERSLNIDFILGMVKTLLKKRKDLKLIITSATIDTEKFSLAFDNAPVVEVSGRLYPVHVEYFSERAKSEENGEPTHVELAAIAVDRLQKTNPFGDVLVFMPTEQDIRETCELLEGRSYKGTHVLPLYARLPVSEQTRIFSPMPGRKIVVATNVAETSITIPGIKYVIDSGLARISRYMPRSRTTSLPVVPISKSSADQRKGRCGRLENGICIRLFSEEDFESRPLYTPPEILRANLAEVILRMIALNLGNVAAFPFIDRPDSKSIQDGFDLLSELGAISAPVGTGKTKGKGPFQLTKKGRLMAQLPVDPRLSRMLIEAKTEGCLEEITIIAAALSIHDPRERPAEDAEAADRMHAVFTDPSSDFMSLLNIWNAYHDVWKKEKSSSRLKKYCRDHFLSYKRMREWRDIYSQITTILEECGFKDLAPPWEYRERPAEDTLSGTGHFSPHYMAIHKCVLSGFLSNIAVRKEKNTYKAAKGREVMIFPGSGLFNKASEWIVAAEIVETTKTFARTAANIDNNWLEALGQEQCKRSYLHPHWERNREEVVAFEQVTLYGLTIVPQRRIAYGQIDPDASAEIFIQCALVQGDVKKPLPFMEYNRQLIDEIVDIENRIRRRDLLVGEQEMMRFYTDRLNGIHDVRALKNLIRKKGGDAFLRMMKKDLLVYWPEPAEVSLFPDRIDLGKRSFSCSYCFEPGSDADGITVQIPSSIAAAVPAESTDWVVPGLMKEKITALIKALPKSYRKQLVPVVRTVDVIMAEMPKTESALVTSLSRFIDDRFGVDIPASVWSDTALPDHLQLRITLTGPHGEELQSSRDRGILREAVFAEINQTEFESAKKIWERTGITCWDFEALPESIALTGIENTLWTVYPGLEACQNKSQENHHVNLRLFQNRAGAIASHKAGVCALFCIHFSKDLKFLKKRLVLGSGLQNQAAYFGGARRVEKRMYERVINELFSKNIRSKDRFYSHAESTLPKLFPRAEEILGQVIPVLNAFHEASAAFFSLERSNIANKRAVELLGQQRKVLRELVPENFIDLYDTKNMAEMERYIRAILIRAQRGIINFEKDQVRAKELQPYTKRLQDLLKEITVTTSSEKKNAIEEYFWLIEEYKVSLFAQELKTRFPVSKKRLDKKLKEIEKMI